MLLLTPEQRLQAVAMYAEGQSARQIARHFGCSHCAARNALKAEGVQFREKFEARKLRDHFPNARYPQGKPVAPSRRCGFVFNLAAHI